MSLTAAMEDTETNNVRESEFSSTVAGLVKRIGKVDVRKNRRSRAFPQKTKQCVTFGRLPLLPLRLIHDFLKIAEKDQTSPVISDHGTCSQTLDGNAISAETCTKGGGDHCILFILSRRLAFQVKEAVSWKEFYTAETLRLVLSPKEVRRFVHNIHKAQLLIRTELKLHEWSARGYAKHHTGINYACGFQDRTPRISAVSEADFLEKHQVVGNVPVVVTGLTEGWPALRKWRLHRLCRHFGGMKWRVGDDDDGYPVSLRFVTYMWHTDPAKR